MAKPTKLFFKNNAGDPFDHKTLGQYVDLKIDGESGDAGAGEKTAVIVRVFYRVDGMPFAETLYNGDVTDNVAGTKKFETIAANLKPFRPVVVGSHDFTAIAWDHKAKADTKEKTASVEVQIPEL